MAGEKVAAILTQPSDSIVPLTGRMAFLVSYLVSNQSSLELDRWQSGQLRLCWGSGHLKCDLQSFLPGVTEPDHV